MVTEELSTRVWGVQGTIIRGRKNPIDEMRAKYTRVPPHHFISASLIKKDAKMFELNTSYIHYVNLRMYVYSFEIQNIMHSC